MSRLLSEKWDGDATQWAEFKIFIKKKLMASGNANMIIPEGEPGYIPDVPFPLEPPNFDPHTGLPRSQQDLIQWRRECDRIRSDAMDLEGKAQKALATILENIGEDATDSVKHITNDEEVSYKQKCQWIMEGLANAHCGNNDTTRVELIRGIEEIAGIDTRQDATKAITIIDDVNAELATHINLRTGERGYYRQSDETKMNKYIKLLREGTSNLFANSIDYLVREKHGSRLTWELLKLEVQKRCRELQQVEKDVKLKKGGNINQVSSAGAAGKTYEDGMRDGLKRMEDDRRQDRDRIHDRSRDRGSSFDRNADGRRYTQEDNRRGNGSSSYDRRSESRERGRNDRGREDRRQSESQGSFRRGDFSRREDSPFRPQYQASGSRYRDEPSRDGRDRSRERSSSTARRENENERFDRRIVAYMKQQSQGAKSPGKSRE